MRYVHTMIRVTSLEESLDFWVNKVGLVEMRRVDNASGKYTNVFLAAPKDEASARASGAPELELTFNWDSDEVYATGRSWGHLAYKVDDIYAFCQKLMDAGITINRPPRDGRMAFFKSPDHVSVELIQDGESLPIQDPWASMPNDGSW
ncbi:MAG TPA: lactoylglutathione lyase [Rhodobacteraceae bacterium]|nr:lactoylglutathione lyase [Paracoccaceae bacterium]